MQSRLSDGAQDWQKRTRGNQKTQQPEAGILDGAPVNHHGGTGILLRRLYNPAKESRSKKFHGVARQTKFSARLLSPLPVYRASSG